MVDDEEEEDVDVVDSPQEESPISVVDVEQELDEAASSSSELASASSNSSGTGSDDSEEDNAPVPDVAPVAAALPTKPPRRSIAVSLPVFLIFLLGVVLLVALLVKYLAEDCLIQSTALTVPSESQSSFKTSVSLILMAADTNLLTLLTTMVLGLAFVSVMFA
jgi:hypothetical protein